MGGGAALLRQAALTNAVGTPGTAIATLAHPANDGNQNGTPVAMCYRPSGLYVRDTAGNLNRIVG